MELARAVSKSPRAVLAFAALAGFAILLYVLWRVLNGYISPGDDPEQRTNLIQAFAVIVGGTVAFLTALVGFLNLRHNQRALQVNLKHAQKLEAQREQQTRELEAQRAGEAALQRYFELVKELLTDEKHPLQSSEPGDNRSTLARAQTLAILEGLDPVRKRILLQFLYESGLVHGEKPVVSLQGANLQGANLQGANLQGANLGDFFATLFVGADPEGANLYGANLYGAQNLTQEQIEAAHGDADTQLPEGLTHPESWAQRL